MKKSIMLVLCLALGSGLGSMGCGGDEEGAESETPNANTGPSAPAEEVDEGPAFRTTVMGMEMSQPLVTTDLTEAGFPGLTIVAPEEAQQNTTSWGSHRIVSAGVNYSVTIREGAFDADSSLTGFRAVDPDGSIIEQTDDTLIYRRSGENGSHLFSAGVTVGETAYACGNSATAFPFSRSEVDQMITS